jgi:glycosyltransferase involved in cell wall biosynthesis
MLRVLQVVLSLNPGGTERLVVEIARRLHPDIPMAICCLDEPGAWAEQLQARGIEVAALRRQPGFQPGLGGRIASLVKRFDSTVLHAHHYSPFVYAALSRLWVPRARIVFTEHGRLSDAPPSKRRKAANLLLARLSSATFTVSRELRDHVVAEGFRPQSVGVIYNGIDPGPVVDTMARTAVRAELHVDDQTLVVGTIARLDPVKDLGTLVQAAARVARSRPVLVLVVGDGPERPALERMASAVGLPTRFLGHRDDARKWLAGCDIYANSSISEGVSLTILEAMAAGLAVVATRVGGTPEVLDETCGRLVAARSAEGLATTLEALAQAPESRRNLGRAARERVERQFSLERMVTAYRVVYERLG